MDIQAVPLERPNSAINLRRIVNNTVVSIVGQAITWSSTLLLTMAYGRFLGDATFGDLYFALTIVLLVGFPIECGFNQQLTRDVAREPSKSVRHVSSTVLIKTVLWVILFASLQLVTWTLGYTTEVRTLVRICGVMLLATSLTNTFAAAHIAFERSSIAVIGAVLEKGLTALVGIAILRQGGSVVSIAFVLLGGALTNVAWQASAFYRLEGVSFRIYRRDLEAILRASIPFIVYGAIGVIYYRLDTVLLSLTASRAVVGWYGAGYRIFDTLNFLPNLVTNIIMYPVFAKLSLASPRELKAALEKTLNVLLCAGVPMAIGLLVTAPAIVTALYRRPEFLHTVPVLQALAPGLICLYVNCVLAVTLLAAKRERALTRMAAIALVFNLGLNLLVIPRYQHVGAAAVTSLTELLLVCLGIRAVPHALRPYGSVRVGLRSLAAGLVMAAVVLALNWRFQMTSVIGVLTLATLAYVGSATLLGTIPAQDVRALYRAIRYKAHGTIYGPRRDDRILEMT